MGADQGQTETADINARAMAKVVMMQIKNSIGRLDGSV